MLVTRKKCFCTKRNTMRYWSRGCSRSWQSVGFPLWGWHLRVGASGVDLWGCGWSGLPVFELRQLLKSFLSHEYDRASHLALTVVCLNPSRLNNDGEENADQSLFLLRGGMRIGGAILAVMRYILVTSARIRNCIPCAPALLLAATRWSY
jgi:hypothetical protein